MSNNIKIEASWKEALKEEFNLPYFEALISFIRQEIQNRATDF